MYKFIKKIIIAGIFFYISLWIVQFFFDHGLRQNYNDTFNNINLVFSGTLNSDIICIGSSRTLKHFNATAIENKTGLSTYNLGLNGAAVDVQGIYREAYFLKNKNPKVILQNVDITSIIRSDKIFEKETFIPYINHKIVKNNLQEIDRNIRYEYFLPMYKYRGYSNLFETSLKGYLQNKDEFKTHRINGYSGSPTEWNGEFERSKDILQNRLEKIDPDAINYGLDQLKVFINEIKEENIFLALIWSPEYVERMQMEEPLLSDVKAQIKKLSDSYDFVYFWDFTSDELCLSKVYFYDSYHLNDKGATIFSKKVADSINKWIQ